MQATILDLRYKMAQVVSALDRRETVEILYRGKLKGVIVPAPAPAPHGSATVREHPYFGCRRDVDTPVDEVMSNLRGGRYR